MNQQEIQRWYLDVVAAHNNTMYATLIHEHNVTSSNLKEVEMKTENDQPVVFQGYFASKDRTKYFLDAPLINLLPLKAGEKTEELTYKEDVVYRVLSPTPFKITPEQKLTVKELVDGFAPFTHQEQDWWTLTKLITFASFIGRTYVCLSSESSFGKTSLFNLLHAVTDKCPVFQPRSVPGVLRMINGTGNIVFDEAQQCKKEVKDIMEEFSLQIAGGQTTYQNGALRTNNTKDTYDCHLQSITYLYNNTDQYKDPHKNYFEFMFRNTKAINDRFLKMKLPGRLAHEFTKDFSVSTVADKEKMYYIHVAKTLLYLQKAKRNNTLPRRYETNTNLLFKGRRRQTYNEISWLIDQYASSQEIYDKFISLLDNAIIAYDEMIAVLMDEVSGIAEAREKEVFEEYVE